MICGFHDSPQKILWLKVKGTMTLVFPGFHSAGIVPIGPLGTNVSEILMAIEACSFKKCICKCGLENGGHFVSASLC